jgi:hypothetical protein
MQGKVSPERSATTAVYVGIDVCKDVYVDPVGLTLVFANSPEGIKRLKRSLKAYGGHARGDGCDGQVPPRRPSRPHRRPRRDRLLIGKTSRHDRRPRSDRLGQRPKQRRSPQGRTRPCPPRPLCGRGPPRVAIRRSRPSYDRLLSNGKKPKVALIAVCESSSSSQTPSSAKTGPESHVMLDSRHVCSPLTCV